MNLVLTTLNIHVIYSALIVFVFWYSFSPCFLLFTKYICYIVLHHRIAQRLIVTRKQIMSFIHYSWVVKITHKRMMQHVIRSNVKAVVWSISTLSKFSSCLIVPWILYFIHSIFNVSIICSRSVYLHDKQQVNWFVILDWKGKHQLQLGVEC